MVQNDDCKYNGTFLFYIIIPSSCDFLQRSGKGFSSLWILSRLHCRGNPSDGIPLETLQPKLATVLEERSDPPTPEPSDLVSDTLPHPPPLPPSDVTPKEPLEPSVEPPSEKLKKPDATTDPDDVAVEVPVLASSASGSDVCSFDDDERAPLLVASGMPIPSKSAYSNIRRNHKSQSERKDDPDVVERHNDQQQTANCFQKETWKCNLGTVTPTVKLAALHVWLWSTDSDDQLCFVFAFCDSYGGTYYNLVINMFVPLFLCAVMYVQCTCICSLVMSLCVWLRYGNVYLQLLLFLFRVSLCVSLGAHFMRSYSTVCVKLPLVVFICVLRFLYQCFHWGKLRTRIQYTEWVYAHCKPRWQRAPEGP